MSNPFKVVVTDFVEEPATFEREILGEYAEVETLQAMGEENLVGKVEDADAIMIYHYVTITRPTIERLDKCRLIVRCGVGYDNIDCRFARERGIDVANVPDYGSEEVADSAIGMALALARGLRKQSYRYASISAPYSSRFTAHGRAGKRYHNASNKSYAGKRRKKTAAITSPTTSQRIALRMGMG